jgi:hypothetical protein
VIVSPEEKEAYMTECPEAFLLWEKIN